MSELQRDTKKGNIKNKEQNDIMNLLKTIYHTKLEPLLLLKQLLSEGTELWSKEVASLMGDH